MGATVLVARLIIAAIFGTAFVGKCSDPRGTRVAIGAFGVPQRLVPLCAFLVPACELVVVALVVPARTAWVGAIGAAVLLAAFTAAIAVNLARGHTPDCHCFGVVHSAPVSSRLLWRNLLLAVPVGIVVAAGQDTPGYSIVAWMTHEARVEIALLVVIVVAVLGAACLCTVLARVIREQRATSESIRVLEAIIDAQDSTLARAAQVGLPTGGLAIGSPAPAFTLHRIDAELVELRRLLDRPLGVLAFFISPTCGPCKELLALLPTWQEAHGARIRWVAITRGPGTDEAALLQGSSVDLLVAGESVAEMFGAQWTPGAVHIDARGAVRSPTVFGLEAIERLVADTLRDRSLSPAHDTAQFPESVRGRVVAPFTATTPRGATTGGPNPNGSTALVFWRPSCPHCIGLADDLAEFARTRSSDQPELVYVNWSSEADDMAWPAVHADPLGELAAVCGVPGTPAALLIDDSGVVVSELAVGADEIRRLLDVSQPGTTVLVAAPTRRSP